jgi:hypothetical protein
VVCNVLIVWEVCLFAFCQHVESIVFFNLLRIRPCGLFQFRISSETMNHRHMVGLLGRVISSSQGLYLRRTTQHRERRTNIHALNGIRTCDPVYERSRPAPQTAQPLDRHQLLLHFTILLIRPICSVWSLESNLIGLYIFVTMFS